MQNDLQEQWKDIDVQEPHAVVARAMALYHPKLALASSFGLEDVALIHMMVGANPEANVFALDTGRLPEETYECAERIRARYHINIEWYFPSTEAVEKLEREKGLFSFRESVANRKECCGIRKVEPLARALKGLDAWITGQRREQNITRATLDVVERDNAHGGIVKINPLADWTLEQTRQYVMEHDIPYNALHDRSYPSIGCAPCTRAVETGEDQRAGRWWWEEPEHKECGLHNRPPSYNI
jgi:phosphoadenosine phosphosulfate reductase